MTKLKLVLLTATTFLLISCASSTKVSIPNKNNNLINGNSKYQVSSLTSKTPEIPEHFSQAIKSYLNLEMQKSGRLAINSKDKEIRNITIDIQNYRMRSGFSRSFLGVFAGKDGVDSIVTITNPIDKKIIAQAKINSFNISALGGPDDIAKMHAEEIAKFINQGHS